MKFTYSDLAKAMGVELGREYMNETLKFKCVFSVIEGKIGLLTENGNFYSLKTFIDEELTLLPKHNLTDLKELVLKATPMKPVNLVCTDRGTPMFGDCPNCGKTIYAKDCCSNNDCRQAIDWGKNAIHY